MFHISFIFSKSSIKKQNLYMYTIWVLNSHDMTVFKYIVKELVQLE